MVLSHLTIFEMASIYFNSNIYYCPNTNRTHTQESLPFAEAAVRLRNSASTHNGLAVARARFEHPFDVGA